MKSKNKNSDTNEGERKRDLVAEKLIMNELLNSDDFSTLLQTTIDEFKRTFTIVNENITIEEEKEIE